MSPNYIAGYQRKQNSKWPRNIIIIIILGAVAYYLFANPPQENTKTANTIKEVKQTTTSTVPTTTTTLKKAKLAPSIHEALTASTSTTKVPKVKRTTPMVSRQQQVIKAATCNSITSNNLPKNSKNNFSAKSQRIYYYTKIKSKYPPTTVRQVWHNPQGKIVANIPLYLVNDIADTYSYYTIAGTEIGKWKLETRDASNNLLDTTTFIVGTP